MKLAPEDGSEATLVCGAGHTCGPGHYAYERVRETKRCPHRIRYQHQFVGWAWKSCGRVMKPQNDKVSDAPGSAAPNRIPRDKWEWYGNAGHLCVSNWCRFHLTTKIGKHLVSTVGEYYPPHATERDCPDKPTTIGYQRTYETMVFEVQGVCECGCGLPTISGSEIEADGYNDPKAATAGHHAMCERVASGNYARVSRLR